jgi:hypothetical protein
MTLPFAASFVRAASRQVTAGALPTRSPNEWAIYQCDLEITRELAKTSPQVSKEIRRLETIHCSCQTETRTA